MNASATILRATVKEHAQRKVIVFFAAITGLVTLAGVFLARRGDRVVEILGGALELHELLSIGILGLVTTVAALIVSMGTIRPAMASGEAESLLTRAVTRRQWVLARLGASVLIVAGLTAMAALGSLITALASEEKWSGDMILHWGSELFGLVLLCLMTAAFSGWFRFPALAAVCGYLADQAVSAVHAFFPMVGTGDIDGPVARIIETAWVVTPKVFPSPLVEKLSFGPQVEVTGLHAIWAVGWLAALTGLCVWRAGRLDAS